MRVLDCEVRLIFGDQPSILRVTPNKPAPIPPQAEHHVETDEPMQMQVEFYREYTLPGAPSRV